MSIAAIPASYIQINPSFLDQAKSFFTGLFTTKEQALNAVTSPEELRALASRFVKSNPSFADDLYAAAERWEVTSEPVLAR